MRPDTCEAGGGGGVCGEKKTCPWQRFHDGACKRKPGVASSSGVLSDMSASVAMSPIAMVQPRLFRSLDVNVVLEAESFAEFSAASNAVSEPVQMVIRVVRGLCDALNCDVAKICSASWP